MSYVCLYICIYILAVKYMRWESCDIDDWDILLSCSTHKHHLHSYHISSPSLVMIWWQLCIVYLVVVVCVIGWRDAVYVKLSYVWWWYIHYYFVLWCSIHLQTCMYVRTFLYLIHFMYTITLHNPRLVSFYTNVF